MLLVEITYNKIIKDLEDALAGINANDGDIYRLNRASILGYLSKIYLYKGIMIRQLNMAKNL